MTVCILPYILYYYIHITHCTHSRYHLSLIELKVCMHKYTHHNASVYFFSCIYSAGTNNLFYGKYKIDTSNSRNNMYDVISTIFELLSAISDSTLSKKGNSYNTSYFLAILYLIYCNTHIKRRQV